MYYTINQLIEELENFGLEHQMINTVSSGEIRYVDINKETLFPLFHIQFLKLTPSNNFLEYSFRFIVMDVPRDDDRQNEQEVISDSASICLDLLSWFIQEEFTEDWTFVSNTDILPFTERFDSVVTGNYIDINFKVPFKYPTCNLPIGSGATIQTQVTVKNSDGTYIKYVRCGNTLILADTTYNVYVDGILDQSFTEPSMIDIDIYITN